MVKRKDKSKRIKQASKDYLRNNNSTEENKTKEKRSNLTVKNLLFLSHH
jgi:hypothetical protein